MTLQAVLLGLVVSTICGLFYHLIRGGPIRRMVLFVTTAWLSFFCGHLVGNWIGWTALRLGTLNLLPALVAAVLALIGTDILARSATPPSDRHDRWTHPADEDE